MLKRQRWYDNILFFVCAFSPAIGFVFLGLKLLIGAYISFGVFIIGFLVIRYGYNTKSAQKKIIENYHKVYSEDRMKKVIDVLLEFDFDIANEKQLDNLVELASDKKSEYDLLKDIKTFFGGLGIYIIIPIITLIIAEALKGEDIPKMIAYSVGITILSVIAVIVLFSWSIGIKEFFNFRVREIEYLILDIKEVKAFRAKAIAIAEDINKSKTTKMNEQIILEDYQL